MRNFQIQAVGVVRQMGIAGGVHTSVAQSALPSLPDGTVIFAMKNEPAKVLIQEAIAIEQLDALMQGDTPSLNARLDACRLARAVIGSSRQKIDLMTGTVETLRAALEMSETVRRASEIDAAAASYAHEDALKGVAIAAKVEALDALALLFQKRDAILTSADVMEIIASFKAKAAA